jgi:hypothetical protein
MIMAHQRMSGGFADSVGGTDRLAAMRCAGARIDDRAATALDQLRHRMPGAKHIAAQVDAHRIIKNFQRQIQNIRADLAVPEITEIRMKTVKAAKVCNRQCHDFADRSIIRAMQTASEITQSGGKAIGTRLDGADDAVCMARSPSRSPSTTVAPSCA